MFKLLKNRVQQGYKTSSYPKKKVILPESYRGLPFIKSDCPQEIVNKCAEFCPQEAINPVEKTIDLKRCVFCGNCERISKGEFVVFSQNYELASDSLDNLIRRAGQKEMGLRCHQEFSKLFGHSLQLRVVSAGGCNACEADTNVLNTPFFDLSRFGIQFVASPRHADGLLITGPLTKNMEFAVNDALKAVPNPKVVIAVGSCALSGGVFRGNPEQGGGIADFLKVDLYIPGCPPHPLTILDGLLTYFGMK